MWPLTPSPKKTKSPKKPSRSGGFSINKAVPGGSQSAKGTFISPTKAKRSQVSLDPTGVGGGGPEGEPQTRTEEERLADGGTGAGTQAQPKDGADPSPTGDGKGGKKGKFSNRKKPSAIIKDFLHRCAPLSLRGLLKREAEPGRGKWREAQKGCTKCLDTQKTVYRCSDCEHAAVLCRKCLLDSHIQLPFHFVKEWMADRGFWREQPLSDLGIVIHLGHEGQPCPRSASEPRKMTIVCENGVHTPRMRFCGCHDESSGGRSPDATQLLENGYWPASWDTPMTAFTLKVMKAFSLLSLQANANAYDYYETLRRRTDGICPREVPDRYQEFISAHRVYSFITAAKRSGLTIDELVYGSLVVHCPACPQPKKNMDPNWRSRSVEKRFMDALFYAIDGNFHANLKEKPRDEEDFPLTKGAGHFAHEDAVAKYLENLGSTAEEPSTCSDFKAMKTSTYAGKVSGVVGVFCARHMFALPGGHVDLQKGERFANVDLAVASALQGWVDLLMHIGAYDIWCQYQINRDKRMKKLAEDLKELGLNDLINMDRDLLFPFTIAGIGKFHIAGHRLECRYRFSLYYLPGSAMGDGEGSERVWSVINPVSKRAREMNAGHRHDIVVFLHNDLNVRKVHDMPYSLTTKYNSAVEHVTKVTEGLEALEEAIEEKYGEELVPKFKNAEKEWKAKVVDPSKHDGLENPYDMPRPTARSQQELLRDAQEKLPETTRGTDVIGVLSEGIELQEKKAGLLLMIDEEEAEKKIEEGREQLENEVVAWRARSTKVMGAMLDLARSHAKADARFNVALEEEEDVTDAQPASSSSGKRKAAGEGRKRTAEWVDINDMAIILPSSCGASLLKQACMAGAIEIEVDLRKAQAEEALDALRTHIITSYTTQEEAKQRSARALSGHAKTTRYATRIANKQKNIDKAAEVYRRAQRALYALGVQQGYPELAKSDCRPFAVSLQDPQLGSSRQPRSSWIWQRLKFLDNDHVTENFASYAQAAIKVHWFRMSALKSRWDEEKLLVEEEMRRVVRFFKYMEDDWLEAGFRHEAAEKWGNAGYARKQAYRYERLVGVCRREWDGFKHVVDVDAVRHCRDDGHTYNLGQGKRRYVRIEKH